MFHNGCGFEIRCRHDDAMGKPDVSAYLRSLRIGRYTSATLLKEADNTGSTRSDTSNPRCFFIIPKRVCRPFRPLSRAQSRHVIVTLWDRRRKDEIPWALDLMDWLRCSRLTGHHDV
jgi:hypothetical protein